MILSYKKLSQIIIFHREQVMKATPYFEQQVLRKRPYLQIEWCEKALLEPVRIEFSLMVAFDIGHLFLNLANICELLHWAMAKLSIMLSLIAILRSLKDEVPLLFRY